MKDREWSRKIQMWCWTFMGGAMKGCRSTAARSRPPSSRNWMILATFWPRSWWALFPKCPKMSEFPYVSQADPLKMTLGCWSAGVRRWQCLQTIILEVIFAICALAPLLVLSMASFGAGTSNMACNGIQQEVGVCILKPQPWNQSIARKCLNVLSIWNSRRHFDDTVHCNGSWSNSCQVWAINYKHFFDPVHGSATRQRVSSGSFAKKGSASELSHWRILKVDASDVGGYGWLPGCWSCQRWRLEVIRGCIYYFKMLGVHIWKLQPRQNLGFNSWFSVFFSVFF